VGLFSPPPWRNKIMEEQLKTAYAELAKNKGARDTLAELVVEYIDPEHVTKDIVGMFLNTRTLKPGDALD